MQIMRDFWKKVGEVGPRGRPQAGAALLLLLALAVAGVAAAPPAAETPDARGLVSAVVRNQQTTGSKARLRLAIEPPEGQGPARSLQVLLKSRREGATQETLVMVQWPREEKGRAWMIRRTDSGEVGGFRFMPPNEVTPVTAAELEAPLFGSDLSVDDFAESFWNWPEQQVVGVEKVGSAECWVVESRTSDASVRHPRVRSWLAKDKPIALRVDKSDKNGELRKRLTAGRVVRRDEGGWVVAEWMVETVTSGSRTRVTGSRSDRDLTLPASEFSPEGVRQLLDSR